MCALRLRKHLSYETEIMKQGIFEFHNFWHQVGSRIKDKHAKPAYIELGQDQKPFITE